VKITTILQLFFTEFVFSLLKLNDQALTALN